MLSRANGRDFPLPPGVSSCGCSDSLWEGLPSAGISPGDYELQSPPSGQLGSGEPASTQQRIETLAVESQQVHGALSGAKPGTQTERVPGPPQSGPCDARSWGIPWHNCRRGQDGVRALL